MNRSNTSYSSWAAKAHRYAANLTFLGWLRLLWFVLILWIERVRYSFIPSCEWGDRSLPAHANPTHVLLVSDPRVRYAPLYRSSIFGNLHHWLYELSLRRTWQAALSFKPHTVVFLGDMLASGRKVKSPEDFDGYFTAFTRIFATPKPLPAYFTPGNEDIGLNLKASDVHRARENYIDYFGSPNTKVSLGNHTLVLLDAPGLVEEDYQRAEDHGITYEEWVPIKGGAVAFVKSLQGDDSGSCASPFLTTCLTSLSATQMARTSPEYYSHTSR
ncbi:hypothetical protein NM688_g9171 [Phlebia brevispora]|uniref:Uncharacterized protein n=1 Tax=Phlebia brevispora TaxID=194682 RepID=A0ACC1RJX2_9APHY|nr:hypothetical protein NM688_g9171 [Phlebia brevispora]